MDIDSIYFLLGNKDFNKSSKEIQNLSIGMGKIKALSRAERYMDLSPRKVLMNSPILCQYG